VPSGLIFNEWLKGAGIVEVLLIKFRNKAIGCGDIEAGAG
jgi:hypothetical protein